MPSEGLVSGVYTVPEQQARRVAFLFSCGNIDRYLPPDSLEGWYQPTGAVTRRQYAVTCCDGDAGLGIRRLYPPVDDKSLSNDFSFCSTRHRGSTRMYESSEPLRRLTRPSRCQMKSSGGVLRNPSKNVVARGDVRSRWLGCGLDSCTDHMPVNR